MEGNVREGEGRGRGRKGRKGEGKGEGDGGRKKGNGEGCAPEYRGHMCRVSLKVITREISLGSRSHNIGNLVQGTPQNVGRIGVGSLFSAENL